MALHYYITISKLVTKAGKVSDRSLKLDIKLEKELEELLYVIDQVFDLEKSITFL